MIDPSQKPRYAEHNTPHRSPQEIFINVALPDLLTSNLKIPALAEKYGVTVQTVRRAFKSDLFEQLRNEYQSDIIARMSDKIVSMTDSAVTSIFNWLKKCEDESETRKLNPKDVTNILKALGRMTSQFAVKHDVSGTIKTEVTYTVSDEIRQRLNANSGNTEAITAEVMEDEDE